MFYPSLACAFLLAGATAQETDIVPVSSAVIIESSSLLSNVAGVSSVVGTAASSVDGFVTIQTSVPSSLATAGESTSACLEICVVEPCTRCVHARQAHLSRSNM